MFLPSFIMRLVDRDSWLFFWTERRFPSRQHGHKRNLMPGQFFFDWTTLVCYRRMLPRSLNWLRPFMATSTRPLFLLRRRKNTRKRQSSIHMSPSLLDATCSLERIASWRKRALQRRPVNGCRQQLISKSSVGWSFLGLSLVFDYQCAHVLKTWAGIQWPIPWINPFIGRSNHLDMKIFNPGRRLAASVKP